MTRRRSALSGAVLALLLGAWLACRPAAFDRPRPPQPIRPAPPLADSTPAPADSTGAGVPGRLEPEAATAEGDFARANGFLPDVPPAPSPPAPPPSTPRASVELPALIRVGLESDLEVVTIPCCPAELEAHVAGERLPVVGGLTIRPAPEARGLGVFRLQVGAMRDESQSHQLARRLGAAMGVPSDVVFDAGSGLHKVRVGAYPDRPSAEVGKRRLAELGIAGAFTVHEDHGLENAGIVIEQGASRRRLSTRAVDLSAPSGLVRYGKAVYRGRLRVFLNERGRLNVINELDLESYLRGVVPMELGPELYPQLDALKAQAVAARTYTVRNLGRFSGDGYDICATPRCQVYGGVAVEHPLSDRAVAETAGELALFEGGAIDALYSSTCGGRTEGVASVFPEKHEPYLASVPCVEAGGRRFGSANGRASLASWLLEVTLGTIGGDERARLEERIRRLAQLVAVPRPGERLGSLERSEVRRFLDTQLDLALDHRILVASSSGAGHDDWAARDRRLVALLEGGQVGTLPSSSTLGAGEADELALELLRYFSEVDQFPGRFLDLGEAEIEIASGSSVTRLPLATTVGTWRLDRERLLPGPLELAPGDPVDLHLVRGAVVALVQHAATVGAAAAVRHDRQRWTRFRARGRVERLVREHFPAFELEGLVVLERGASGRVASLELVGRDGRREVLAGLPIRWTLDVPDTWFELTPTRSRSGDEGWLIEGRGWGHGVGMCQVGAFAMARRGHDYREILQHYYRGVEVRRPASSSPVAAAQP